MSHTPTPWVCLKGDTFNPNRPYGICKYLSREAHYEIDGDDMDYPSRTEVIAEIMEGLDAKEDAELIVKAVNSHQAMKEALEDALYMIIESIKDYEELMVDNEKSMTYGPWVDDMYNTQHKIEKALTLANGGTNE